MSIFQEELTHVLGLEKGYSDAKNDRGGATNFGVTEAVAREHGYQGDMKDYTLADASVVYQSIWNRLLLDPVANVTRLVASEVFDTAVNCGDGNAVMFLQRSLNALNRQGKDYPDIQVDGGMGPGTLNSLTRYMAVRQKLGETVLLKALNSLQAEYYIRISEHRQEDEDFVFGWINQRVAL